VRIARLAKSWSIGFMGYSDDVIQQAQSSAREIEREPARRSAAADWPQSDEPRAVEHASRGGGSRRRFLGRSGRILIYTPPLIQLFFPTKAMAASPSS